MIVDENVEAVEVNKNEKDYSVVIKSLSEFNENKQKRFLKKEFAVPFEVVEADKKFIDNNLRTGIELESAFIPNNSRLNSSLIPTASYDVLNDFGVERVYCDGSILPYGKEIVFTGSNESFIPYCERLERVETKIARASDERFEVNNGSTSCHITLITPQFKKMPKTYLANFYQLYRKYCDAILWLCSATYENRKEEMEYLKRLYSYELINRVLYQMKKDKCSNEEIDNMNLKLNDGIGQLGNFDIFDMNDNKNFSKEYVDRNGELKHKEKIINPLRIIRRGIKQYAMPLMRYSPIVSSFESVVGKYGKYYGINFDKQNFTRGNASLNGIFLEIRVCDRIVVPQALTSIKCMFEALLLKAIDLSAYGLLNVECNGFLNSWQITKECVKKMMNGEEISEKDRKYLTDKSIELIKMLKPYMARKNKEAAEILKQLAEKPISIRYREGKNNKELIKEIVYTKPKHYESEMTIRQIMTLGLVEGNCQKEWKEKVANMLKISERSVEHNLQRINETNEVIFDNELKGYVIM